VLGVGERLADFELQDTARRPVTRAYFDGAPGVIAFYPRAFTGG
jgi:peroxiredoxin